MMRGSALTLTATIALPPSINQTYKAGTSRNRDGSRRVVFYKDAIAKDWLALATAQLRRQGWKRQPPAPYVLDVTMDVFCSPRRDLDNGIKGSLDLIAEVLGIGDERVRSLHVVKVQTTRRAEHRLTLAVTIAETP